MRLFIFFICFVLTKLVFANDEFTHDVKVTFKGDDSVIVISRVEGEIIKVHLEENDFTEQGQTIVSILHNKNKWIVTSPLSGVVRKIYDKNNYVHIGDIVAEIISNEIKGVIYLNNFEFDSNKAHKFYLCTQGYVLQINIFKKQQDKLYFFSNSINRNLFFNRNYLYHEINNAMLVKNKKMCNLYK
ncbi:hypothetical protein CJF42_02580 [Pseudoalteromonas sp. NBT06-2]|uniref:biotin/lipoyl-containing protein n=1 Tax=Pseudoalteromonas sp. NBT06-2 TaxID=2025950 RepID=UPI000BA7960D|nr:biotin/lipoyl-containing protein [Pseudoalteromonas sp. NBT06-2]PAJ75926.1 hypothetical protein CJF42_02580 [Pseudoalteromonas sp. NBT06-2]